MLPDYLVNLLCMSCVFLKGLQNASKTIKIAIISSIYDWRCDDYIFVSINKNRHARGMLFCLINGKVNSLLFFVVAETFLVSASELLSFHNGPKRCRNQK